jgi:hypothetical protein
MINNVFQKYFSPRMARQVILLQHPAAFQPSSSCAGG